MRNSSKILGLLKRGELASLRFPWRLEKFRHHFFCEELGSVCFWKIGES